MNNPNSTNPDDPTPRPRPERLKVTLELGEVATQLFAARKSEFPSLPPSDSRLAKSMLESALTLYWQDHPKRRVHLDPLTLEILTPTKDKPHNSHHRHDSHSTNRKKR